MPDEIKPGTAPDPGKGGETPAAFDPSKIDLNTADLSTLSADELRQLEEFVAKGETPAAAAEPAPDAAGDKPPEKKEETSTEPGAPAEGEEPTPKGETTETKPEDAPSPSEAPVEEKKYAGKYKTTDDLARGVGEAGKVLGFTEGMFEPLIEAAKKSGDWSAVEATYSKLNSEVGRRGGRGPEGTEGVQEASRPTPEGPTPELDEKVHAAVTDMTFDQLQGSVLAGEFRKIGRELPKDSAAFEELTREMPYLAMRFREEFARAYGVNIQAASKYVAAVKSAPAENARALDSGILSVREEAKKYGVELSDADVEAIKSEVSANPVWYNVREGVRFLRPDAVKAHFMATRLPMLIPQMIAQAKAEGRIEASRKMEELRRKEVHTVSTSPLSGSVQPSRSTKKKVDENDLAQIEALSDEELEEATK